MDIGIMQSRLSPIDLKKAYQYWPEMWWDNEFRLAKLYGFSHIEWIYDDNPSNLLNTDIGVKEILHQINRTGVNVDCICADYFVKKPFWADQSGIKILNKLIVQGFKLGVRNIVLPLLEESSFGNHRNILFSSREKAFVDNIVLCLDTAGRYMINICLETDLSPEHLEEMLRTFDCERLGICHDTGNVQQLGYNAIDSFSIYRNYVKHIHLKDKVTFKSENVEIGTGDVDFRHLFKCISVMKYDGSVTLQCARKEYDLDYIKRQFKKVREYANA